MDKIINGFLLTGDKFMPQMHSRQPGFSYSACRLFTKDKERIQKFKKMENSRYIYQNKRDKARAQHDIVYGDFMDLPRRTDSDKVLRDKAFNIAKNPKIDGHKEGLDKFLYE